MAGWMNGRKYLYLESVKLMFFFILLLYLPHKSCQYTGNTPQVTVLQDGQEYVKTGSNYFCYHNSIVPTWKHTWTRIQVRVWSSKLFKVETVRDEQKLQELEQFSVLGFLLSFIHERYNETTINISLYSKKTCFKIDPADETTEYTVKALRKFDIYLFLVFLMGALLFVFANSLSRSQIFYYSAGMSTGIIASLIILIFVLARFLPKNNSFYMLVVGGWSFSLYTIQLVYKNLALILTEHWKLAFGYVAVVGFISFAACYRYGPLVDEKSIDILSWTLQLFGLLLIYSGIQIQQVALAIIVAAFVSKNLEYPVHFVLAAWRKVRTYIHWKPEPRRLLTEEEYQIQGEVETQRALEELRKFCNSPEFSPWKAVSRLQSPKRFADFVEGSPHLLPNEVSDHAQEYGIGGSFFEDELFDTEDEDGDGDVKPDGSYTAMMCNN
ncbi:nuclear envelope integral membrane protein 1 [Thalassophryne amazonica]|uniref:nuclear envelope integral membrane protein 1 n=1 Tax=Thalassophryne amazonica TaxID=390379 RepID=UPI001471CB72|nr:nuclear envelope integral membrane protein 1 [Thalassophryne amazonica]